MYKQTIIYHVYVEGKQERIYLNHIKDLINSNEKSLYNINFVIKDARGSNPSTIVNKAIKDKPIQIDNKLKNAKAALFDYGFKDEFLQALKLCKINKVCAAYSIVNFDLWILLHKKDYRKKVNNNSSYKKEIIRAYNLDDNDDIKKELTIKKMISQISIEDVIEAIKRAEEIEKENETNKNILYKKPLIYDQPNVKIYEYIKTILEKAKLL